LIRPVRSPGTIIESSSATEFAALWDRGAEWDRRMEMIARARSFLYLSTFYIEWDEFGRECLAEILKAQQRGVATVLIIDRFGQWMGGTLMSKADRIRLQSQFDELRKAGGRVVMYSPENAIDRKVGCGQHIKIQLSDRGDAIFGSSNITRSSFNAWNEFSVALRGPIVRLLMRNFFDLLGSSIPEHESLLDKRNSVSQHIPLDYWSYDPNQDPGRWGALGRKEINPLTLMLADKIRNAKNTIQVTSFYYKPARLIAEAIKEASSRGVTVDVFHSHASALNTRLPWLAAATDYPSLAEQGVRIYENRHGEHSKIVLIDDQWTAFGSYNFEDAADSRLSEAMIVTKEASILDAARTIFQGLAADSDNHLVTSEEVSQWPVSRRVATRLFRPIKHWF
jgi:phosphatidylserine/phosphatidylglycerophosphate/cardiolipin synthase-like enzyme